MKIKFTIYEKERKQSRTVEMDRDEILLAIRCYFLAKGIINTNYTYEIDIDEVTH